MELQGLEVSEVTAMKVPPAEAPAPCALDGLLQRAP